MSKISAREKKSIETGKRVILHRWRPDRFLVASRIDPRGPDASATLTYDYFSGNFVIEIEENI